MAQKTNLRIVKKKVKAYLRLLQKEGIKVDKITLFGSYAKGKAKRWSDIDLCVASPSFGKKRWMETRRLNNLALKIDERLQPLPFNPTDLKEKYSTLVSEIKKSGIEIKP